jgi:hypothetical protein
MAAKVTTMNPFSWTSETWYFWLSLFALIFVWLSVLTSLGALYASRLVNNAQAARARTFELELAKQQERAAKAEKETLELRQKMLRREIPRWVLLTKIDENLKGKATAAFEIVFEPNSDEIHKTALSLEASLSASGGWKILRNTRPYSEKDTDLILPQYATPEMSKNHFNEPFVTRIGGWAEFSIIASPADSDETGFPKRNSGANVVTFALMKGGFRTFVNSDDRLPAGHVRIIVGPRE